MQTSSTTVINELFMNPTTIAALPGFLLSLGLAAVLGYALGQAYVRFGHSATNRRALARNFLLLTVTTTLVIAIIKSSLALSLGLVGALSIVRFRAAVKEPEELAFLFLAISTGLGLGAGQALITIVALAVIVGLIAVRSLARRRSDPPNLFVTVNGGRTGGLSGRQIMELLDECGAAAVLRRYEETPDGMEASYQVQFSDTLRIEEFTKRLRTIDGNVRVMCVEDRGICG